MLEANQSILDINENNDVIAVILPNDASLGKNTNGSKWAKDGSQDGIGRVKLSQIEALTGFDLLNNIYDPLIKQQLRNKVYENPYLSSPLKAESNNSSLPKFAGNNTTITSNSILEQSSISNSKITYGIEESGIFENSTDNRAITNVSSLQVSSSKVAAIGNRVSEIAIGQVSIGEIDTTQVSSKQYSSSPINSGQIRFFSDTDINEISLPSSISFEQFLNSNISRGSYELTSSTQPFVTFSQQTNSQGIFSRIDGQPIHNNVSNLLTSIYSTAQSIWQTNTPINLNFEVTNLPTGQLAEATITRYDTNGRPNAATISIDTDANGVGWFIDPTPQDNSEFHGVDNYYQATSNSVAAGKYDLLTAILHEMGHTLGFINGYSQFNNHIKGNQFITGTQAYTLSTDLSHLDNTLHPNDLLDTNLKPGIRKLPSTMDWAIINAVNSGINTQTTGTLNPAHLNAGTLL